MDRAKTKHRAFGYVRSIDGNKNYIVDKQRMQTIGTTDYQNREWILAALNHFYNLPVEEQKRLTQDQHLAKEE